MSLAQSDSRLIRFCFVTVTVLAVSAALYLAQPVLKPFFLAILLRFVFRPIMRQMERIRIPSFFAAGIIVSGIVAAALFAAISLREPTQEWAHGLPNKVKILEQRVRDWRVSMVSVSETAKKIETMTTLNKQAPQLVQVEQKSLLVDVVANGKAVLITAGFTLIFLFMMLAYGEPLVMAIIRFASPNSSAIAAEQFASNLETELSTYLLTVVLINCALAAAFSIALYFLGIPNPMFWGLLGGLFNFVPYLSSIVNGGMITVVSLLTFDDPIRVVATVMTFVLIDSLEGGIISPLILGRRFTLNPIIVLSWISLWIFLWGPVGGFMAVPLLVTGRIIYKELHARNITILTPSTAQQAPDPATTMTQLMA